MTIKNLIAVVALIGLASLCARPAEAQTRGQYPIGYLSVSKILSESADAQAGAKQLEALRQAKSKDLIAKKQALDATRLEIANSAGYFSGSKRDQLKEQEKKQEADLQAATQQAQTEFNELTRKIQDGLRAELTPILNAIATQRGYQYILNQDNGVLLAPPGADLTKEVLDRLNAAAAERAAKK